MFHNGGEEEVYLASADWMTRNLDKRIELMFPVEDRASAAKVVAALDALLRDTVKGRRLQADGRWQVPPVGELPAFDAQEFLIRQGARGEPQGQGTVFEPLERPVA